MTRYGLLLVIGLATAPSGLPGDSTFPEVDQAGNPVACDLRGRVDMGWGFSIDIPPPLAGCNMEMHDTYIPLGERSLDHVILSSGTYNATCITSLDEISSGLTDLSGIEDIATQARVRSATRSTLGGLPAVRVIVDYRHAGSGERMVRDTVVAFSAIRSSICPAPDHEYSLILTTTRARYREDLKIFEALLNSCRPEKARSASRPGA